MIEADVVSVHQAALFRLNQADVVSLHQADVVSLHQNQRRFGPAQAVVVSVNPNWGREPGKRCRSLRRKGHVLVLVLGIIMT
ncbi:unnamed protein product [Linum trigynum]|uniref:Uncharacterized protein n=1 Tax=Linum trigynum TaxID=586398 RepID=A0AAV2FFV0_9ROSI